MPYDVVAYEADENARLLTAAEEGIFHRMMRLAWMNGSVPSDLHQLADLCRIRPSSLKAMWPNLSKLWVPLAEDSSRLQNKKLESERIFLESKRCSARESAKLSWKSKKRKKVYSANAKRTQSERFASLPSPSLPSASAEGEKKPTVSFNTYGEFSRVLLTEQQHEKLKAKLNGSLEIYIDRFDRWVNEAPKAKDKSGIRREDRHAYESISSWFDKDGPKVGGNGNGIPHNETATERRNRKNQEFSDSFDKRFDDATGEALARRPG